MATLNEMRARDIFFNIQDVMIECSGELRRAKERYITGEITANKARRIYFATMKRISFYNKIRMAMAKKYDMVYKGLCECVDVMEMSSFEKYIKFFEG